jgi:Peptidase family S41
MKNMVDLLYKFCLCFLLLSNAACNISRSTVHLPEKIDPASLKKDVEILHRGLQEYHPSLYAYIPKTEFDSAFNQSIESIQDSLSESEFAYKIVAPFIARIRCGHTSVSLSSHYMRYLRSNPPASFPLFLKFFGDTMMVSRNLHRNDSLIKKGTRILNINGLDSRAIKNRLFSSFPTDGYAESVNLARINNNFPFYYRIVMGVDSAYTIDYLDEQNTIKTSTIKAFKAGQQTKTNNTRQNSPQKRPTQRSRDLELRLDTGSNLAYMFLANFDHPLKSHRFIRKSFNKIKQHQIEHLIIDLRTNGGGVIDNEVFLARHLRKTRFRVADSAVAIKQAFMGYGKYFRNEWINGLIIKLFTREDEHGRFHMTGYWEKRQFKPIRHRFFHGQVYILTGGMTFSAASLFCITLKGQDNVRLIGEETGGSGYANNGLLIPDFVLPYSRVKVRVPLFRLVPDSTAINNGRGVFPDIPVSSTSASLKAGFDPVMFSTLSLIRKYKEQKSGSSDHK